MGNSESSEKKSNEKTNGNCTGNSVTKQSYQAPLITTDTNEQKTLPPPQIQTHSQETSFWQASKPDIVEVIDFINPTGTFSYFDATFKSYWRKCSFDLNDKINDAIGSNKSEIYYDINGVKYRLDIRSMTQYNVLSNKNRRIRNNEYGIPMYWSDLNMWKPYPNDVRQYVCEAMRFKEKKVVKINGNNYEIDPLTNKQKNVKSGFTRNICLM
jgi:hypothetical protein